MAIHIHTTAVAVTGTTTGCMLELRPWLSRIPTCASLEINYAFGQHQGGLNIESMRRAILFVDPLAIQTLVMATCARLYVPPAIQSLRALRWIKIYNSTIVKWDAMAELRHEHNPNLLLVYIANSNLSSHEVPPGMLGDDVPHQLVDVEFSGTNLVKLPTDLHTKWPSIMYFVLERSPGITEFPETIAQMRIPQLMLGSNSIESVPNGLLADQAVWKLMLDGNPLGAMPDTIGDITDLYKLGFAFTDVQSLPVWAATDQSNPSTIGSEAPFLGFVDVFAGGSPLCGNASASIGAANWVILNCDLNAPTHAYPIENERQWRAESQRMWG